MAYPSAFNTFVPEASADLRVRFSRNPNSFPLNRYVTIKPVEKMTGYFSVFNPDEAGRAEFTNNRDAVWADGAEVPRNFYSEHDFVQYTTTRYADSFALGDLSAKQASWDIVSQHAEDAAHRMMVRRSLAVLTALTDTNNFTGATASATTAGGGKWDASDATNLYIKKSLQYAVERIERATNGAVSAADLILVISPNTAHQISSNAEIHAYLSGSPFALQNLEGRNMAYGLTDNIYGLALVVENTSRVTSKRGATRVSSYILDDDAVLVARPNGLESNSTLTTANLLSFTDMEVSVSRDEWNERTLGKVVDNWGVVVRGNTGFLLSDVVD